MFYKFSNITGRIAPSTQAAAYSPQGMAPLAREPSVFTFDSKKTQPVHEPTVTAARPVSSSPSSSAGSTAAKAAEPLGVVPTHPRYQRIVEMQNIFLKQDGRLVWQKFGKDRAFYYATIGLLAVSSAVFLGQLYKMCFPKRSQD